MRDFQDNFQETHNGAVEKIAKIPVQKTPQKLWLRIQFQHI